MRQFDVFPNPVARARGAFPFVVLLQSRLAEAGDDRVVAPITPRVTLSALSPRLMPMVMIEGREQQIFMPGLSTVPARRLTTAITNLTSDRDAIIAAIDYLFLGF